MNNSKYINILKKFNPKISEILSPPKNRSEYDQLCELSYQLTFSNSQTCSKKQNVFLHLINLLIEEYDNKKPPIPNVKPFEVLKYLMEENGLVQKDLIKDFGSQGMVSKILNGKRNISVSVAKKLSKRFNTSIEVFLHTASK